MTNKYEEFTRSKQKLHDLVLKHAQIRMAQDQATKTVRLAYRTVLKDLELDISSALDRYNND